MKEPIPYGYCHCGCGQKTPISKVTDRKYGYVRGVPKKFVCGHTSKGRSANENGYILTNGYKAVLAPAHPRAMKNGRVYEHILIAEAAIGKYLPLIAEAHHINGIKTDNRQENLVVCQDKAYHLLLHKRQKALEICGHANWLRCQFCKKYDDPKNLVLYASEAMRSEAGYHRSCRNSYKRNQYKNRKNPRTSDA